MSLWPLYVFPRLFLLQKCKKCRTCHRVRCLKTNHCLQLFFLRKLLHCTALSPVQCNNFLQKTRDCGWSPSIRPDYMFRTFCIAEERGNLQKYRDHRDTLARTDAPSRRPGFARVRNSQHMGAAVCGQPLYVAIARSLFSKKCRDEDAQELNVLINRAVSYGNQPSET